MILYEVVYLFNYVDANLNAEMEECKMTDL